MDWGKIESMLRSMCLGPNEAAGIAEAIRRAVDPLEKRIAELEASYGNRFNDKTEDLISRMDISESRITSLENSKKWSAYSDGIVPQPEPDDPWASGRWVECMDASCCFDTWKPLTQGKKYRVVDNVPGETIKIEEPQGKYWYRWRFRPCGPPDPAVTGSKYKVQCNRPTIAQLEAILAKENFKIEVLPNGEIRANKHVMESPSVEECFCNARKREEEAGWISWREDIGKMCYNDSKRMPIDICIHCKKEIKQPITVNAL